MLAGGREQFERTRVDGVRDARRIDPRCQRLDVGRARCEPIDVERRRALAFGNLDGRGHA